MSQTPPTLTPGRVRLAGVALNQIPLDWQGNYARASRGLAEAKKDNAKIICLPELVLTGYGCEDMFFAPWVSERALTLTTQLAAEHPDIGFGIGVSFWFEGDCYNGAAFVADGEIKGIVGKQFLANSEVYYEPRWYKAWPRKKTGFIHVEGLEIPVGDLTFDYAGERIGFEICEDAWRERDRPGFQLRERGVTVILNPSASHFTFGKTEDRMELVTQGSKAFGCRYVYSNLLGNESGRVVFDGEVIISDSGRLRARNHRFSFKTVDVVCEDARHEDGTADPGDDFSVYEEFTAATALGLFDYMRKARARGFALSLSGGADSGVCALLVSETARRMFTHEGTDELAEKLAYWPEIQPALREALSTGDYHPIMPRLLVTAYQPTENSGNTTREIAEGIAREINSTHAVLDVQAMLEGYEAQFSRFLGRPLDWQRDDLVRQNIQARTRAPMIWMLANERQSLLITTSNRSEGSVGYCTMDGDTAGGVAPIASVSKKFVLEWVRYAYETLGYKSMKRLMSQPPTAELRPGGGQTDEEDLMPYPLLDAIERLAVYDKADPTKVLERLREEYEDLTHPFEDAKLEAYIDKFYRLWAVSQWKRERLAPGFHLDDYSVDPKSWCRFPILSVNLRAPWHPPTHDATSDDQIEPGNITSHSDRGSGGQ